MPQDNIWVTDKGSDQVVKFDRKGRVVMVFGRKQEASDEGHRPAEASESRRCRRRRHVPPGHRYRLGFGRQRLHQRRLHQLARRPVATTAVARLLGRRPAPEPGQLNTPHSIAVDAKNNVYVADRGNRRIQVFDTDGTFNAPSPSTCRTIPTPSRRSATSPPAAPARHAANHGARLALGDLHHAGPEPGALQRGRLSGAHLQADLDGKVLGVLGTSGKQLKQFGWIHEMACPSENTLFVASC
jgi:hypothetical protein